MTIFKNFFSRRINQSLRPALVLILAGIALWMGLHYSGNHSITVASAIASSAESISPSQPADDCDKEPTGVESSDYFLEFNVPHGLMPDPQFDGKPARLEVHRVRPVYARGKCDGVPNRAIVLIQGRTVPGPVVFDTRHPTPEDPGGGKLSMQEALARAGIDTFAPSLLGYGLSTRFENGLDDPCNASLPPYNPDGVTCSILEGCDRSFNTIIFPLNQQTHAMGVNPFAGHRCKRSSNYRFARMDVWARDVIRVIDDAIARAQPDNEKVVLVGASLGGVSVARALYLLGMREAEHKVDRVVFLSSLFDRLRNSSGAEIPAPLPTEENELSEAALSTSFPMALFGRSEAGPPPEGSACAGRIIPGLADDLWEQLMERDVLGREWGGTIPGHPTGVLRAPTFSNYGWNPAVAETFTIPTLVLQGFNDQLLPLSNSDHIYDALTSVSNKALVQVKCATHVMMWDGCSGARCKDDDPHTKPYGGNSQIWAGPYSTVNAALIEWVKKGKFNGEGSGRFVVNESGVVIN